MKNLNPLKKLISHGVLGTLCLAFASTSPQAGNEGGVIGGNNDFYLPINDAGNPISIQPAPEHPKERKIRKLLDNHDLPQGLKTRILNDLTGTQAYLSNEMVRVRTFSKNESDPGKIISRKVITTEGNNGKVLSKVTKDEYIFEQSQSGNLYVESTDYVFNRKRDLFVLAYTDSRNVTYMTKFLNRLNERKQIELVFHEQHHRLFPNELSERKAKAWASYVVSYLYDEVSRQDFYRYLKHEGIETRAAPVLSGGDKFFQNESFDHSQNNYLGSTLLSLSSSNIQGAYHSYYNSYNEAVIVLNQDGLDENPDAPKFIPQLKELSIPWNHNATIEDVLNLLEDEETPLNVEARVRYTKERALEGGVQIHPVSIDFALSTTLKDEAIKSATAECELPNLSTSDPRILLSKDTLTQLRALNEACSTLKREDIGTWLALRTMLATEKWRQKNRSILALGKTGVEFEKLEDTHIFSFRIDLKSSFESSRTAYIQSLRNLVEVECSNSLDRRSHNYASSLFKKLESFPLSGNLSLDVCEKQDRVFLSEYVKFAASAENARRIQCILETGATPEGNWRGYGLNLTTEEHDIRIELRSPHNRRRDSSEVTLDWSEVRNGFPSGSEIYHRMPKPTGLKARRALAKLLNPCK